MPLHPLVVARIYLDEAGEAGILCAITLLKGVSRFPGPPDPVITTVRVWDRVFSTEGAAFLVDKSFRPVRFGNHKQKSTDARAEAAGDGQSGEVRVNLTLGG